MSVVVNAVKPSLYMDSVALMRCSKDVAAMDGIEDAALMMGTPANRQIMTDAGLLAADGERCQGGRSGDRHPRDPISDKRRSMRPCRRPKPSSNSRPPEQGRGRGLAAEDLRAGLKAMPDANLALISVPGDYAAAEARKALNRGLNVMIFSDNVPIEAEIALKQQGRELGLSGHGPDCGTAILSQACRSPSPTMCRRAPSA